MIQFDVFDLYRKIESRLSSNMISIIIQYIDELEFKEISNLFF